MQSLQDLSLLPKKISFPEPRTSTLGLQFYYWMYSQASSMENLKSLLKKLKNTIYGSLSSWSLSYGLFQKNHVDMSLSYLTSLIYHHKEQRDTRYKFAYFKEGHPYQVEFAGIPASCVNCNLAQDFVLFLTKPPVQKILLETHYMLPVIKNFNTQDFLQLRLPKLISYKRLEEFLDKKQQLLKMWQEVLE